jgi:hypothetical protein
MIVQLGEHGKRMVTQAQEKQERERRESNQVDHEQQARDTSHAVQRGGNRHNAGGHDKGEAATGDVGGESAGDDGTQELTGPALHACNIGGEAIPSKKGWAQAELKLSTASETHSHQASSAVLPGAGASERRAATGIPSPALWRLTCEELSPRRPLPQIPDRLGTLPEASEPRSESSNPARERRTAKSGQAWSAANPGRCIRCVPTQSRQGAAASDPRGTR